MHGASHRKNDLVEDQKMEQKITSCDLREDHSW